MLSCTIYQKNMYPEMECANQQTCIVKLTWRIINRTYVKNDNWIFIIDEESGIRNLIVG